MGKGRVKTHLAVLLAVSFPLTRSGIIISVCCHRSQFRGTHEHKLIRNSTDVNRDLLRWTLL